MTFLPLIPHARTSAVLLASLAGLLGGSLASSAQTYQPATVTVATSGSLGPVPFTGFGIGTAVYDNNLNTPSLPGLLQDAGITTLRYPGGGYADEYHWSTASKTQGANAYIANGTDFGHFTQLAGNIGGTAVITVNYYSNQAGTGLADPFEAAAWVAYANGAPGSAQAVDPSNPMGPWQTVGYWASLRASAPVSPDDGHNFLRISHPQPIHDQYWEIGNEVFYPGEPYSPSNPTGMANLMVYGSAVNHFSQVMKAIDPSIKIGVDLLDDPVDYTSAWNPPLLQICGPSIDFGIAHFYPPHNSDAQLLSESEGEIPGPHGIAATLRSEYQQYCGANAPNVQTLITETGYTYGTDQSPVVDALLSSDDYATWLENGISNIDYNQLTSVLDNDTSPQPSYYGIQMTHFLETPGDTMLAASTNQSLLHAHAAHRANGDISVMLVNTDPSSGDTATLSVPGVLLASSGTRRDYSETTNGVTVSAVMSTNGVYVVTIPPYTITTVDIPTAGPVANGTYHIQSRADSNFLDSLGYTAGGSPVGQWPRTGSANQSWTFVYASGYYTIQDRQHNLLDTLGHKGNATSVGQAPATGSPAQQWSLVSAGGGYYKILNRASGEYLDTLGYKTTGALVGQYAASVSYNQQWLIQ